MAEKAEKKVKKPAKKLQIKDLEGRELSGRLTEQVKGGAPRIICLSVAKMGLK